MESSEQKTILRSASGKTRSEILKQIQKKRDVFRIYPDRKVVEEIYYNPRCYAGGQIVFNYFSFLTVLGAREYDPTGCDRFFEYLDRKALKHWVDIDDDLDLLEEAVEMFNEPDAYEGRDFDTLLAIEMAALDWYEKMQKDGDAEKSKEEACPTT